MKESNALKLVIASLLAARAAGMIPAAGAGGYCSIQTGCQVIGYRPPGGGFGGGGSWGSGDGSSDPKHDNQRIEWCQDFPAMVWEGAGCDVHNPPPLQVNGCGAAGGPGVPDYLIASPALQPGAAYFGYVFRQACDVHDMCYGTAGSDKHQCDERLRDDMIAQAQQSMGDSAFVAFGVFVVGQATAYAKFLQWEWVEPWTSLPAFIKAQEEAFCRQDSGIFKGLCG